MKSNKDNLFDVKYDGHTANREAVRVAIAEALAERKADLQAMLPHAAKLQPVVFQGFFNPGKGGK